MAGPDGPKSDPVTADPLSGILGAAALHLENMRATGDRVQDIVSGLVAAPGADLGRDAMIGLQGLDSLVQQLSLMADLLRGLQAAVCSADPECLSGAQGILSRLEGAAAMYRPDLEEADFEVLAHTAR